MDLFIFKMCFKKGTCFLLNMRTENGIEYAALELFTWHLGKSAHRKPQPLLIYRHKEAVEI